MAAPKTPPRISTVGHVRTPSQTIGIPTSPGPPVIRLHDTRVHTNGGPSIEILPTGNPATDALDRVLQQVDNEAIRQALEDKVHAAEVEREEREARENPPIVDGVKDQDFQALLRSFDKQIQNVKSVPPGYDGFIPHGLEIQTSAKEEFSVDRVRSSLERFYSTVVVGIMRMVHEIQRIRHWEDGGYRSLVAMTVYIYAWYCEYILTTLFSFLSLLVLVPSSRDYFFEPPLDLDVDVAAPNWGPAAIEANSSKWANNILGTVTAISSGQGGQMDKVQKSLAEKKDEMLQASIERRGGSDDQVEVDGETKGEDDDKADKDKAIDLYARPAMRVVGGLADKWERIANALSPQPEWAAESRLKSVWGDLLAPALILSVFVTERMIARALGAAIGLVLFGQPLISYTITELDRAIPDWKERVILLYNILEHVPTNTQLVFRILRRAEHGLDPIPPAPTELPDMDEDNSDSEEPEKPKGIKDRAKRVIGKVASALNRTKDGTRHSARHVWDRIGEKKENGVAIISGRKEVDLAGKAENTLSKIGMDDTKAGHALIDHLPSAPEIEYPHAPSRFYVRHHKHGPGHILLYPPSAHQSARIEFTTLNVPPAQNGPIDNAVPVDTPHLVISINQIVGLRKQGMSLPARAIIGWALDTAGAGQTGLQVTIVRRDQFEAASGPGVAQGKEEVLTFSGIIRRDELFDRLLAVGNQQWEMY